ncbi:MAG: sigma-54-dependent Fis family transcriptional regulator [Candidatus Hydrogenedentes bacterium]|nr:sigma-54-dependent Fis family transcriptional regulator [Candidatus Hydrogenedentota bacterium]
MSAAILTVDDEKIIRWTLRSRLEEDGYEVVEAESCAAARAAMAVRAFDLALIDMRLPDGTGMELLAHLQAISPDTPVIIVTAYSSVESAVGAIRAGAADYVTKPFNLDELSITVRRTLEMNQIRQNLRLDLQQKQAQFGLGNIVGESRAIQAVKSLIRKVSKSSSTTVLVLGESGTGKDLIARAIHYESERAAHPFMNITCTALPETLLESELFGFEAGAFTNARERKKGLFELAQGGSVFMDEIGDMTPALQAKLLRVLEEKAFKRIGGSVDLRVDMRIIAATNRNLEQRVREGEFREDLYFRLNIVPIEVPPLRDREEDVVLLAAHFLRAYRRDARKPQLEMDPAAIRKLGSYDWPGNVRELRNVIERAVLLCEGDCIYPDDLVLGRSGLGTRSSNNAGPRGVVNLPSSGYSLHEIEREVIVQALERAQWNQTHASKLIGITRDQMRYKMEKFGLKAD